MAYVKHNYQSGDVLMAEELNEMDSQLVELEQGIDGVVGIPEGGTVGQVLAKISNQDHQIGWVEPSAGITSYSDLSNKPSINGTVLTGNRTLAQIGAYQKPNTGIPASDLADGVIPDVHNVPSGGEAGQVLSKASSNDYDLQWVNQSGGGGGGGGTSDYADLVNKPKIDGVTLSGDVTKESLDIHSIPAGGSKNQYLVKSSASDYAVKWASLGTINYNNLSNKPAIDGVALSSTTTLNDIGAYQKPVEGIPASDLASGVIPEVHNVPSGGTTGQVLAKSSNSNYALTWVTPSSGGGSGTSNYNELTNRPSLNGTLLQGSLTSAMVHVLSDYHPVINGSISLGRSDGSYLGTNSLAAGFDVEASADYSHAEGSGSVASGVNSHAEGSGSAASGINSHAEGQNTRAYGSNAHAEGEQSIANGNNSHVNGLGTVASHKSQHVFGEYNVPDSSKAPSTSRGNYVEIVGNGASPGSLSNARTLDWNGNERLAGDLYTYAGTNREVSLTSLANTVALISSGNFQKAPSNVGTPGQVLGLNNLLQPVWTTVSGGGALSDLGYVTPEMYGAVGDGSTNDENAFTSAIATGLPIFLTRGKNYFILQLTITRPFILYGNHATISTRSITSQEYDNGLRRMLIFSNEATQVYIRDVNFYTTADQTIYGAHGDQDDPIPNRSMRAGMSFYGVEKAIIENCRFTNFDNPIQGQKAGDDANYEHIPQNVWIVNSQFHNCLMGIFGHYRNLVVDGCEIIEDENARSGEHGIYLIIDAIETVTITGTNIYTYNGSCGSCIQFYPTNLTMTLPVVDKREYKVCDCMLIGDAYISNAGPGNVYVMSSIMKTINYNIENRRRQFECALTEGYGYIEVSGSSVNLELNDSLTQNVIFRNCNIYSQRIAGHYVSDRSSIYKAYNCQFDNVSFKVPNNAEYVNCVFSSSLGVTGRYYLTAPLSTTSAYIVGCSFNTGSNVNNIAYAFNGTCTMVDIISSLPIGNDNPGLTVRHLIDPTSDDEGGGGGGGTSIYIPKIENNLLMVYTTSVPSDGYTTIFTGTYTKNKDAGDSYSYIYNNNVDMTIAEGDMFKVTFAGTTTELIATTATINGATRAIFGNPGVVDPNLDDGSGLTYVGYMHSARMIVIACADSTASPVPVTVKKKIA